MSKSRRRPSPGKHQEAARSSSAARSPAASNSYGDMLYRFQADSGLEPSTKPRLASARRTPAAPKMPRKGPVASLAALFGTWAISPTSVQKKRLQAAFSSPCAKRAERREVLFATRGTGKGARASKKHFTNKRCK